MIGPLQDKYYELLSINKQLLEENERLRRLLEEHGIEYNALKKDKEECPSFSPHSFPEVHFSLDEKIALFRSLFRGREDVFARRWYSKSTEKGGYQPVCINEWRRGICDKKKQKCADCPNRNFAPLTDSDFYRHLEGRDENCCDVIGLYPIMQNNTCAFLCADFDDKNCTHGYKDDVLAFVGICHEWQIPYSIERSRSGNGAHVWIFFSEDVSAINARRLGNALLTEAMNRCGKISFSSYDRLFPNQDTLPDGGLGNLVALPMQGRARKKGNSVFVDDEFLPYQDQWAYLANIRKVDVELLESVLSSHQFEDLGTLTTSSEKKPWEMPVAQDIKQEDFKEKIIITKADKIYIPLQSVSAKVLNHLKRIAAFRNPEFYKNQALRFSTYNVPRIISCADINDDYIAMPRGCADVIFEFFESHRVAYSIEDQTNRGESINVSFIGKERNEQLDAINELMPHNNGVLSASPAFGKTVTAASLIARKGVNTLVLVHSKALLTQWQSRLSEFLQIDYIELEETKHRGRRREFSPIGCLCSTSNSLHGIIDIALIQSCMVDGEVKPFVRDYGMVIVDECHHVSSVTFEAVLKQVTAQYVYGLTATPIRKDGHQPIIFMQCGPIRYSADAKSQIMKQSFQRLLVPRFTSFRTLSDDKQSFVSLCEQLAEDYVRNNLIVDDVYKCATMGRSPLILTGRTSHVEYLSKLLEPHIKHVVKLVGSASAKEKRDTLERLINIPKEEPLVVVATGKYVGEGFDYPRLDTLFLALPISWKGLVAQYAGRLHREEEGKRDVRIYDYIDVHEPLCDSMYRKRLKGYAAIGYKTISKSERSLFDEADDFDFCNREETIFDGKNYFTTFSKDIKSAKRSILISSPRLYKVAHNSIIKELKDLTAKGIDVIVLTSNENEQTEYIQHQGIHIKIIDNLSLCVTVINRSIVWYGSINFLGFATEEDNVIRIIDEKLSSEIISNVL